MGNVLMPHKAKLISGIIAPSEEVFSETEDILEKSFGPLDYKSPLIAFDFTDYYEKEMGSALKRRFVSFRELISPQTLADIKLATNDIEKKLSSISEDRRRPVNIDPGYLTDAKLVLASTKDHYHRIYLDKGIYAEITLSYKDGSYRPCEWTYPDYRTDDYIKIFNHIRDIYMDQRKPQ